MAITGRKRMNNKNKVKKRPNEPTNMAQSTQLGVKYAQLEGKKSCSSESTITKRSNHMPTFTHMTTNIMMGMLVRHLRNQNNWGETTLQKIMIQYAQAC